MKIIFKQLIINFFGFISIAPAFAQNEPSTPSPFFQFIPLLLIIGLIVIPLLIIHFKYKNKTPEISGTLEKNINLDLNLEPRPWIRYLARAFDIMSFSFFGGTSLLIIVGVALDTLQQIESHLMMRHYDGFLSKGKIRGRRRS